jgi:predicted ATPase
MRIEALAIKNYKTFRHAEMKGVPNLAVIVGANGSGKSTLFDIFGFLKDSLTSNVQTALLNRGGFKEVRSRDSQGPIEIELKFREGPQKPLVTYFLQIDENDEGRAIVKREILKYRRGSKGQSWQFLNFTNGKGTAVTNEPEGVKDESELRREEQELAKPDILAVKGLAQFQRFPAAKAFGQMIENWHVSDFHINSARQTQIEGHAEHLSKEGENLSLVTQYLYKEHPHTFNKILQKLSKRVPGVTRVDAKTTEEGRILLRFQDGAFKDPFLARYVSDGTIKMFAYLVLLHDPSPHPLLCVEEPENQLYPQLLAELAEEFRLYAQRGGQVFVSSHSPEFLNAIELEEVFWLKKKEGYTTIERAKDNPQIEALVKEGDKLGYLWHQGLFEGVGPQ